MVKRIGAVIALACLGLSFVASPSPASADPYTAAVNTRCRISIKPHVIKAGGRVRVNARVVANGDMSPRGNVTITIRRKGGSVILRKTRAYRGTTVTVRSPRIRRLGHYRAKVRFRDSAMAPHFRRCSASKSFRVKRTVRKKVLASETGPGTTTPNNGSNSNLNTNPNSNAAPTVNSPSTPSGVLPDTGGPNVWWLVLGFGLVLSGGGLVAATRRRRTS